MRARNCKLEIVFANHSKWFPWDSSRSSVDIALMYLCPPLAAASAKGGSLGVRFTVLFGAAIMESERSLISEYFDMTQRRRRFKLSELVSLGASSLVSVGVVGVLRSGSVFKEIYVWGIYT